MHLHKYRSKRTYHWFICVGVLLAGSNWNNAANAGVSYRNSNNSTANVNANISRHCELRTSGPEQQIDQNRNLPVKHTTDHPGVLVLLGMFSRNGRAI